jgi:hypothetical protein
MNHRALVFLQEMLQQALAKIHSIEKVCDAGLFAYFVQVYLVDSTGFGLPERLKDLFPGSGGVPQKPGPQFKRQGTIKAVYLDISP